MPDNYHSISTVWLQFPKEYETSTINNVIQTWKAKFENRSYLLDNYITKIIIIGDVSTGKSTLINKFLGRNYVGDQEGHGTKAFFYISLSEKDYEYFTMNNSSKEIRDMYLLRRPSDYHAGRPDDITHNTVFRVYVRQDKSGILERKTVIVDCPGFGQQTEYADEIKKHGSNAGLFIFMFQLNKPATQKQINYIKEIRKNYNNPTCFFVYNKCDSTISREDRTTKSNNFYNLFEESDRIHLRTSNDPIYFISAIGNNTLDDFHRFEEDIRAFKSTSLIRYVNFQSTISEDVDEVFRKLNNFVCEEEKKQISLSRHIDRTRKDKETIFSTIENYVERCIRECKNNLHLEKIFNIIFREINDFDRICYKDMAPQVIRTIENNFRPKIIEFVKNHLFNSCIDPINQRIMQINSNSEYNIKIDNNMELQISTDQLVIPIYKNIENIFWFFEFGNQAKKLKKYYSEFIESPVNKTKITESINNLSENELSNIRRNYENILENYNRKCLETENALNVDLDTLRSNFIKLENYKNEVTGNLERISLQA